MRRLIANAQAHYEKMIEDFCEEIGIVGSLVAAWCSMGIPSMVSFLQSIGLGFLAWPTVRIPLMFLFLGIALLGLIIGIFHHGKPWALVLGCVNAVGVVFSTLVSGHPFLLHI